MVQIRQQFDLGKYDNIEVSEQGIISLKRKNLLENSSFEFDCNPVDAPIYDGLAYGWSIYKPGGAQDIHIPTLDLRIDGSKCQKIMFTSNTGKTLYLGQTINGNPGINYTLSSDLKIDNSSNVDVKLMMEFYQGNTYISSVSSDYASSTDFTRLVLSGSMPLNSNKIRSWIVLRPKSTGIAVVLWVDNVQLEIGNVATSYVPKYGNDSGEYTSYPIYIGDLRNPYKLEITGSIPNVTNIKIQTRSADSRDGLNSAKWYGPFNINDYYVYILEGSELLQNTNLEIDSNNDGIPDYTRKQGYGNNNRTLAVMTDPIYGKSLNMIIDNYIDGDGRWEFLYDGQIETNTKYVFDILHKENAYIGPITMGVSMQKPDGTMLWYNNKISISSSGSWKHDKFVFTTPSFPINNIWLCLSLSNNGSMTTNSYSLKKIMISKEWAINPIHKNNNYIQYKIIFETNDTYYSPLLYDVRINYGDSVPEIHSIELNSLDRGLSYSFKPGETINFKIEVVEYMGIDNISAAKLDIYDNDGKIYDINLIADTVIDNYRRYYIGSFTIPSSSAYIGIWEIIITVNNLINIYSESVFIKIRDDYKVSCQSMKLGILATDYGFFNYNPPTNTIGEYKKYTGVDIWKLGISWNILEPRRGEFNTNYLNSILQFMDATLANGAKVQIGIAQQWWPDWVNNGSWDNGSRYNDHIINKYLIDVWTYLVGKIKNHLALESYLIINEENNVTDPILYIKSNNKVISTIRSNDRDYSHRIVIRPNTTNSYIRTVVAQSGNHDCEYGTGVYPTSSAWYWKHYENPMSYTSYLRMVFIRNSPIIHNGKAGIGEIGFMKGSLDTFGDQEKLTAFERAMSIAYDQGFDDFMLWGTGFAFESPKIYFPRLKRFRDRLINKPRLDRFNVRILIDNSDWLITSTITETNPTLDMTKESYYHLIRTLDEGGYSWFYTYPDTESLQPQIYDVTIKLSDIKGKTEIEQDTLISQILQNVIPAERIYLWNL